MTISIEREAAVKRTQIEPTELIPTELSLTTQNGATEILNALARAPFTSGLQPFARGKTINRVREDASLTASTGTLVRKVEQDRMSARLYAGDGWTMRVTRWRAGAAFVSVVAVTDELAETVLDEATRDADQPLTDDRVPIGFWHRDGMRSVRVERRLPPRTWDEFRHNYAGTPRAQFDWLMSLTRDQVRGRLLLVHGAPGTGKTSAIRILAHEWRRWCQVDCVLDPERLFNDPVYLMDVAIGADDDGDAADEGLDGDKPAPRWRLLLLEDCDELIRSEAKSATGQALSRLLNLTDGLFGQGRSVIVAISTNEDLARLHPATVRPGRCLAQIEVGPMDRDEAVAWLGRSDGIGPYGATLAELYASRDGQPIAEAERPATGMYL